MSADFSNSMLESSIEAARVGPFLQPITTALHGPRILSQVACSGSHAVKFLPRWRFRIPADGQWPANHHGGAPPLVSSEANATMPPFRKKAEDGLSGIKYWGSDFARRILAVRNALARLLFYRSKGISS